MTKEETIEVLQSIEDRAVDFPRMTACDWVAIASAKRHLANSIEVEEADFDKEFDEFNTGMYNPFESGAEIREFARHFFELGLKAQKRA